MNLLLDSHTLVWALHAPDRMRPDAVDAIRDPGRLVCYSAASVWELELEVARRRLELPEAWLEAAAASGFQELPVTAVEAQTGARLPWHHTDPFDRVLIAQALAHGLALATRDPLMAPYGVATLRV